MLHKKLSLIQRNLIAPKAHFNDFGKYHYRSCEDILEAIKPHLDGMVLTLSDEIISIGDRFYIKATATLRNDDGTTLTVTAYAREETVKKGMDEAQITGSASSYARKYALNGLFLIDDAKDSDAANKQKKEKDTQTVDKVKKLTDAVKTEAQSNGQKTTEIKPTTRTPQQIRAEEINALLKIASDAGITTADLMRGIQPKTLTTITVEDLKAYVNSKIDEQNK